jgi:16S rRNA (cytosine1407-C5)-methyltransferase
MSRKKTRKIPEMNAPAAQAAALERFKPLLAPEDFDALLAELERPLFPALRRNPLKSRPEDVNAWAQRYGWDIAAVPYCPDGYWLKSQAQTASLTLEHRMGQFYLQDAASMLRSKLFEIDPQSHPLILDLAASPGGKTTHLTARPWTRVWSSPTIPRQTGSPRCALCCKPGGRPTWLSPAFR